MLFKILAMFAAIILVVGVMVVAGFYNAHLDNTHIIADRVLNGPSVTIDLRPRVYADLPAPVRRYFNFAFKGKDSVTLRGVDWDQTGDFMLPVVGRFKADGQQASHPIKPVYAFTGWFWRYGLPLIESRDAFFIDGHDMRAKLLGWMTVMHTDYDGPEQVASLYSYLTLRYYGQAPLMPWALLPNDFVTWEANGENSAYLSITNANLAGRYLVGFGERGEIVSMEGDRLLMEGNGAMQREVGLKMDYRDINGFMVPTHLDYRWYDDNNTLISHFNSRISNLRLLP